jgi:hypothetical protein
MSLYHKMQKMVDNTVEEFCRRLAEKHAGLEMDEMMALWKETAKSPKKSNGKPKKKTAYMNFSQVMRAQIKKDNPSISFGELSGELARQWKALSPEQKANYTVLATPPPASPVPSTSASASPAKAVSASSPVVKPSKGKGKKLDMEAEKSTPSKVSPKASKTRSSIADLKKLCKDKGLSIKGLKKREEFEELLESISTGGNDSDSDSDTDFPHTLVEEEDDILA